MSTKLSSKIAQKLQKDFKIKVVTEEEAKKVLLKRLKDEEVEGVEEESVEDLMSMLSAFVDSEKDVPEDEDETPKKKIKKVVEEDDDEDETPAPKKKEVKKSSKKVVEEEVEEEDEEPTPKKKAKKVVEEEDEDETPKKKAVKKEKVSDSERYDADNKSHRKLMKEFEGLFEDCDAEVEFKPISNGMSVLVLMKNTKKLMVRYCNVRVVNGTLQGDLDLNVFKAEEAEKHIDADIKLYGGTLPFLPKVTVEDLTDLITDKVLAEMLKKLKTTDKRLGENREKLEAKIKEGEKKSSKKVVDDDDEDETPAPKKKAKKVVEEEDEDETPAKKSKKVVEEEIEEEEEETPKKKLVLKKKK